uniref:Headcase N-terminal domain-containing protein n=1 Tax=Caenorhabditis tropicalis TaxID=1561998 RepID=A0A1I7TYW8_9PELO
MPRGQRRLEIAKCRRQTLSVDKESSTSVTEFVGCPVLDPIQCQCPKEEVDPSDGVKMTCTWESCPYSNMPLHPNCYQMLEDNLVRRLATLGSARGWTVPQRRNNLWERKGQSLIGKFCRCRCDRGQMTRDKQALYEKEKAVEKEKKKKAKKAKQLPQLHFNSKPAAAAEEKKRDVVYSPSATSVNQNQSFSTASRSRLHTELSTSSMRTYTVGRSCSESSFAGETNGQYDNNGGVHPSDCDCVFHYDYDADDDHDHIDLDSTTGVIVPAPLPPPQEKSYAEMIMSQESNLNQSMKKSTLSPDSGIGQTPRLSISSSSIDEDSDHLHQGDFERIPIKEKECLNPLGLSILSSIDTSSQDEHAVEEPPRFIELKETPKSRKKRNSIRVKKNISVSKLPLAEPSETYSDEPRCGFSFNTPVREIMDIWHETATSMTKYVDSDNEKDESADELKDSVIDYNWTPFFGMGFNLGERLFYCP